MAILKQHETGVSVADLAREHGCGTAMIYQWRNKYGGMDASLMKGMKELESENQVWSMDFMSDALADGRKIWTFNVIDDYNREGLAIDVDLSLPSARVIRALEQVIEWLGKPAAIRCDNGPELLSGPLITWANKEPDHNVVYPAG